MLLSGSLLQSWYHILHQISGTGIGGSLPVN